MAAASGPPGDQPGVIELLWGQRSQPKRGPRPSLSLEAIALAAVEIADADGLGTVTMQRVAEALGVTKMALYRYLPGKAELVALMIDTGLGQPPALGTMPGGWRPKLSHWAQQLFGLFWRHPWALEVTVGARAMGPNELGWLEQAVAALTGTGLDGSEMLDIAVTLTGHVRTIAQQGTAIASDAPEHAIEAALTAALHGREDRYPALAAALNPAAAHGSQNQALQFGLSRILDGVELLITARASPRP
jgi:AcrR family transcriptional regulator